MYQYANAPANSIPLCISSTRQEKIKHPFGYRDKHFLLLKLSSLVSQAILHSFNFWTSLIKTQFEAFWFSVESRLIFF